MWANKDTERFAEPFQATFPCRHILEMHSSASRPSPSSSQPWLCHRLPPSEVNKGTPDDSSSWVCYVICQGCQCKEPPLCYWGTHMEWDHRKWAAMHKVECRVLFWAGTCNICIEGRGRFVFEKTTLSLKQDPINHEQSVLKILTASTDGHILA
jgi:hypothetical protein